jgi:hypothetical protein
MSNYARKYPIEVAVAHILAQLASGLSEWEYCQREDIPFSTWKQWMQSPVIMEAAGLKPRPKPKKAKPPYYIYALLDENGQARYVGMTNLPLSTRKALHIDDAKGERSKAPKTRWIQDMLARGHKPEIKALDEAQTKEEAIAKEYLWRSKIDGLTNVSPVLLPIDGTSISEESMDNHLQNEIKRLKRENQLLANQLKFFAEAFLNNPIEFDSFYMLQSVDDDEGTVTEYKYAPVSGFNAATLQASMLLLAKLGHMPDDYPPLVHPPAVD